MSVRIDTTLQTYLAAVTIPGDFSGLPSNDFEVALGSYATPGAFQAPTAVSINGTVSVTLTGRLGAGKSFDPTAATYWLWGRATRSPDETLTRGPTMITVVTTGGTPVGPAIRYVPQQATAPDPTVYEGWLDSSTSPPTLKGWNGTSWVAIGGGGSGGVTSFQTRTGAVSLTKADVTGTGLAAADVGADASGAAATAQTAAIAAAATDATTKANAAQTAATTAAATDATSKVAAEATARTSAIATQHTADVAAFQPIDADLTTIAALDASTAGALATDGAGWIRKTYAQLKTALGLVKADVGLGSVDNTADTAKPVSTAQQTALDLKANLASPTFTGTPVAPTPTAADNSTKLATTAYVDTADALAVPKSVATTKGDLLVATGSAVIVRKGVGSDGQVLTADAASTGGVKWATAAGGSSILLSLTSYAPASSTQKNTTSTTMVAIDTTNLTTASFVAPSSGKVLVRLSGLTRQNSTGTGYWGLFDHGTSTLRGSIAPPQWQNAAVMLNLSVALVVSGLTSGTSYQFDWAWGVTGGSADLWCMSPTSPSGAPVGSPATMEVWSA